MTALAGPPDGCLRVDVIPGTTLLESSNRVLANTPEPSALPAPSSRPLASVGACLPSRQPSSSQRNGFLRRCTVRRTSPWFRSPSVSRPSPFVSIPPPPVAHVNLAGSVVQNHDQVIPVVVIEPPMLAPVDVQHPPIGPARSSAPMRSPLALLGHQPGSLQGLLRPGVAQPNVVLIPPLLVEVRHVQVEIVISGDLTPPESPAFLNRTDHLLTRPDKSHTYDRTSERHFVRSTSRCPVN